jgi:hypothetical protein
MDITKYRFDLVFSYWIFAWFLLYWFRVIPYSPKLAMCLSILENAVLLGIMIFLLKSSMETVIKFLMINSFIKAIPLYAVWSDKINWTQDFIRIIILFGIYAIWLFINSSSIVEEENEILQHSTHKKSSLNNIVSYLIPPTTPGMILYDDLKKNFIRVP